MSHRRPAVLSGIDPIFTPEDTAAILARVLVRWRPKVLVDEQPKPKAKPRPQDLSKPGKELIHWRISAGWDEVAARTTPPRAYTLNREREQ